MARKKGRRFTVEEKLKILEEARQPQTTVAEVCRCQGIDGTTFYRWEKRAKERMREALSGRRRRNGRAADRERLRRELEQKRRVIAEVVEKNLELKRNHRKPRPGRAAAPAGRSCVGTWSRRTGRHC